MGTTVKYTEFEAGEYIIASSHAYLTLILQQKGAA